MLLLIPLTLQILIMHRVQGDIEYIMPLGQPLMARIPEQLMDM